MKTSKLFLAKVVVALALFALSGRAQAVCVSQMEDLTNALNNAYGVLLNEYATLTNNPSPTPTERKQAAAIGHALVTLARPATNTAQLYGLFLKAAQQLGSLALTHPQIAPAGTNVFNAFLNQAAAELGCTADRIAALNDFVRTKRSAAKQLTQAQNALMAIPQQQNVQIALLLGRQAFQKIVTANRLAALGEAKPGFALDAIAGKTLTHTEGDKTGSVVFDNDTEATLTDHDGGVSMATYDYERTGLHTATLTLMIPAHMGGTDTITVKLRFRSNTNGTHSYRMESAHDGTENGKGTFTIN